MKEINLLPKPKQQELAYETLFRGIVRFVEVAGITFAVVFLGQFAIWSFLRTQEVSLAADIEELKIVTDKQDNAELKGEIREINAQITDFKNLLDGTPAWSQAVRQLVTHVPEGMRITNISADVKKKQLEIRGFSPTRELVINFYNAVREDPDHFKSINYPLENVAKPTNVSFSFVIILEDSLLKK